MALQSEMKLRVSSAILSCACARCLSGVTRMIISSEIPLKDNAIDEVVLKLFTEFSEIFLEEHADFPVQEPLIAAKMQGYFLCLHKKIDIAVHRIFSLAGRAEEHNSVGKESFLHMRKKPGFNDFPDGMELFQEPEFLRIVA